jgi:antitoxin FitA
MSETLTKILIRNIPQTVMDLLSKLAEDHGRSLEAEARQALKAWVAPLLQKEEASNIKREISHRLNLLLESTANAKRKPIKISHIAEGIGLELTEQVERWFKGIDEPSFSTLNTLAKYFNANPTWLRHGDEKMYDVHTETLPNDPKTAVQWLLSSNDETGSAVTNIHLIRAMNRDGDFVIVKQFGENSLDCKTYSTGIHVSETIGGSGEAALARLFITLELLYKADKKIKDGDGRVLIMGYLIPESDYESLIYGRVHPLSLLSRTSRWWEDIWDKSMQETTSYWDGWSSLVARINRVIEHRITPQPDSKEIG